MMSRLVTGICLIAGLAIGGCGAKPATQAASTTAASQETPELSPASAAPATLQATIDSAIPAGASPVHILNTEWNGQPVTFVDYPLAPAGADGGTDVALKVFVAANDGYRSMDITTLEQEGGTAEIGAIAFANADHDPAKELIVLITWPVQHADVSGTYYEVRIFDDLAANAQPLKAVSEHFGGGCDCQRSDDAPSQYTFKTVADIRKELARIGY